MININSTTPTTQNPLQCEICDKTIKRGEESDWKATDIPSATEYLTICPTCKQLSDSEKITLWFSMR